MEISSGIGKSVLAGQNRPVPLQPTTTKPLAIEQPRKRIVKIALLLPPEYARHSFLSPTLGVQVEQDWKKPIHLRLVLTKSEPHFRPAFEISKYRTNLCAKA